MVVRRAVLVAALLAAATLAFTAAAPNSTAVDPSRAPAQPVSVAAVPSQNPSTTADTLQPQASGSGAAATRARKAHVVHVTASPKAQALQKQAAQPKTATTAAHSKPSTDEPDEYEDASAGDDNKHYKEKSGDDYKDYKSGDAAGSDDDDENTDLVLQYCPEWRPGTHHQGITTSQRPEPLLNVFSELTADEYVAVAEYLRGQKHLELDDLLDDEVASKTVLNYIHAIHMEVPPKSDVCGHLDHDQNIPPRKARVTIVMGKAEPPSVHDVFVTLKYVNSKPVASNLQHTNILSSKWGSVPYTQRPQGLLDENGAHAAIEAVHADLNNFIGLAFKGWAYGEECAYSNKCIDWTLTYAQHLSEDLPRGAYIQFYWADSPVADGNYIHPIPLQMLVVAKGKSLSHWSVFKVWFNGECFDSIKDLKHAWTSDEDGLRSNWDYVIPVDSSGIYSTFDDRHGKKRGEHQPVGPVTWEPYGRRFTITGGNRVSWLGWQLYVGYLPHYGPRFWDVKFKGERVAYELSLQEAMTMYGGDDLTQTNGIFLDSAFGVGYNFRTLNQGIDCPMNAAFMDVTVFYGGMPHPKTFKNAICVFERHTDLPIMRHYSSSFKFYGAVPGAQLVVRMMSSVYNYDYIHDLVLGVDGMIDVKVYTTGYVQTGPARHNYPKHYGYPLFHDVSGTVHTQVLAWKVDVDIAGTANSVKLHHLKLTQADNGAGHKVWVNKYDAKIAKTEDDSAHWKSGSHPVIPVIINEEDTNIWGSPRGYKVQLHSVVENTQPDDYSRKKGLGFWKWHFVATRHKDLETHSSSCFTQSDLSNPPTSLCDYVDGDSIRKKDVVVWINSGRHHIPVAEDAPVTPTSNAVLGFTLLPFNWADENPATDMVNMQQIDKRSKDTSNWVTESLHKCAPSYHTVPFLRHPKSYKGGSGSDDSGKDGYGGSPDTDYFWSGDGAAGDDGGEGYDDGAEGDNTAGGGSGAGGNDNNNNSDDQEYSASDDGEYDGSGAKLSRVRTKPKFEAVRRMVPMVASRGSRAGVPIKVDEAPGTAKKDEPKPVGPASTAKQGEHKSGAPSPGQKARAASCRRSSRFGSHAC